MGTEGGNVAQKIGPSKCLFPLIPFRINVFRREVAKHCFQFADVDGGVVARIENVENLRAFTFYENAERIIHLEIAVVEFELHQ